MSEAEAVGRSFALFDDDIIRALSAVGVRHGDVAIVHSSVSACGWVCGGAQGLLAGIVAAFGSTGTIVMPAFSSDNSEPSIWEDPAVPLAWQSSIRAQTPAFDPLRSPSRGVGRVPELFRSWPDVRRSSHPQVSFSAFGPAASTVVAAHPLEGSLGEQSPLAVLYALDAWVLQFGTDHDSNTSLHLAESRSGMVKSVEQGAAVRVDDTRQWVRFVDEDYDSSDFRICGARFDASEVATKCDSVDGRPNSCVIELGASEVRYTRMRPLVDFATQWFKARRTLR